jgi:hypothetical protein
MRLLRFSSSLLACVASSMLLASSAHAAKVTEVADAADGDDPFDANLELAFTFTRDTGVITREQTQLVAGENKARSVFARELSYERLRLTLAPQIEIGLFHDLSLFVMWPIVLQDYSKLKFDPGVFSSSGTNNSTLAQHAVAQPTTAVWPETAGGKAEDGKFGFPERSYNDWRLNLGSANDVLETTRAGFDNPSFGLRFSPVNNRRDDTKPTITLQADYTPSLMGAMNPDAPADDEGTATTGSGKLKEDNVADGLHKLHFLVAMSKRVSIFDPYFVAEYTLPFAATTPPGSALTGYEPPHKGGITVGTEIVPFEDAETGQSFAIDLAASAQYVSRGRDYSPVSDAFRELTFVDQHLRAQARVGFLFQLLSYLQIDVTTTGRYVTEHLITGEDFGFDKATDDNNTADLDLSRCVSGSDQCERNEFFNPVIDTPGRRLRIEAAFGFDLMAHVAVTF